MNQEEQKALLEKAARDYPAGTRFISIAQYEGVSDGNFEWCPRGEGIYCAGRYVYYKGLSTVDEWAEIVSKPEENKIYELPIAAHEIKYAQDLKPKEAPQPLDIENDRRYLDFLDEEIDLLTDSDRAELRAYVRKNDLDFRVAAVSKCQLSVQRRYFNLLLSEKDAEIENIHAITNRFMINKNKEIQELTATIAERDKLVKYNEVGWMATQDLLIKRNDELSEVKDTISQQAEEIERLKEDKIQMNMHIQQQTQLAISEFERGEREGYSKGWHAYGDSL